METKVIFRLFLKILSLVLSITRTSVSFQVVRIFQNLDSKLQSYLFFFIYFFKTLEMLFMIHYEKSKTAIHKCRKKQLMNYFFFKIHWKTPEYESHSNKPSYLKPAVVLKKRLPQRCFTASFSKVYRTSTFDNISG